MGEAHCTVYELSRGRCGGPAAERELAGGKRRERTSAIQYKAPKKSIGEIAEELRVDYVLEGSVRCKGHRRVRITGQLIEAREQTHLWSASFNRELGDILEVQSEVARQIGNALTLELLS